MNSQTLSYNLLKTIVVFRVFAARSLGDPTLGASMGELIIIVNCRFILSAQDMCLTNNLLHIGLCTCSDAIINTEFGFQNWKYRMAGKFGGLALKSCELRLAD